MPAWFEAALGQRATVETIDVDGVTVSCRSWGEPDASDRPGVILVHGGAAHARWWDHVAPLLATTRHVVAVDLSGHGDSGWRTSYSLDGWASEIAAVARSRFATPPVVIGHSMGGMVTLAAAHLYGAELSGAVMIDSSIHEATPESDAERARVASGRRRVCATRADILARFRVVPAQEVEPYLLEHVASHSVRQEAGGWVWKFDARIFDHPHRGPSGLSRTRCRTLIVRPEHGLLDAATAETVAGLLGDGVDVVEIPAAGHHVMLDQPLALVATVRTLLAVWDRTAAVPVGAGRSTD